MPCFILQFEYHRLLSSRLLLIHSKMELVSFALSGLDYIFSSVSKSTFRVFQGRSVCPTDMTPLGNTWSPYSKQWEPICYHRLQISDYEDIAILSVCVLIIALQIFLMIAIVFIYRDLKQFLRMRMALKPTSDEILRSLVRRPRPEDQREMETPFV